MNISDIALGLIAGLALFLFGVTLLARGMQAVAGDRMRGFIARATTNRATAVLTGAATTAVLDSSSVTIIIVIALVDAGVLSFAKSFGVILGANIGTTLSSQIIAFDVWRYAPVPLAVGLLLSALGRSDAVRHAGTAILGFGLIFFGLGEMGAAVEPLKDSGRVVAWMTRLERPLLGVAVGALTTIVIQSSSATVGIVIVLASQGLLTLPAGVAVMLGAEIGTCFDTIVATLGRSRAAIRAGMFHLLFNVTTVAVGVALVGPLADLARRTAGEAGVARQIANAHVLFNVLGVLAAIWFLPQIARLLERLIPDRGASPNAGAPLEAALQ